MTTVFAFHGTIRPRSALHTTLGNELVELFTNWLVLFGGHKPDSCGALDGDVFAWSGATRSHESDTASVDVRLLVEQGDAVVTVQVQDSNHQSLFRQRNHRPDVIDAIRDVGTLMVGSHQVTGLPTTIKMDRARVFADFLLSPKRDMAVVVVAANQDGRSPVRPAELALALAGLAQVAHVQSDPVAEQIEKAVGSGLAVKAGEVRVYFPGLTRDASGLYHRLFQPEGAQSGVSIDSVYEAVVRVLARQFRENRQVDQFIGDHPDTWSPASATVQPAAIEVTESPAEHEPPADPLLRLEGENAHLTEQIDQLTHQVSRLERDLFEATERNRQATHVDRFSMDSIHQFALITEVLQVQSLADLVLLYETHVPDSAIVFLPEAHESARKSPYAGGLLGPARLLESVCAVATRYHFGNLADGEDFKRAFQVAGEATFASDSSATTLAKYRSKYTRTYDDGSGANAILLRPHVSFGSGRAHSSVKIYWHVDERNRRFVVGQIGEHLPIASRV